MKKRRGIPQRPGALCSPGHLAEPCHFLVNARFTQKGTSIYSDFERSRERTDRSRNHSTRRPVRYRCCPAEPTPASPLPPAEPPDVAEQPGDEVALDQARLR